LTYIGQQPATTFDSGIQDRFTGLSTNTVTLTHEISAEEDILVVWNNIVQDKNTYSVGGTGNKTLTLGGTLVSADVVTVYYLNKVMQSVNPTAGSVTTTTINDTAVTGAKLNTDVISAQTALGATPADTDELLVSDAGVLKRVDYSYLKSSNTPYFKVHTASSTQQVNSGAYLDPVVFGTELFDSDSAFASNVFTVPSGKGGKYFFHAQIEFYQNMYDCYVLLVKNSTNTAFARNKRQSDSSLWNMRTVTVSSVIDMAAGDTMKVKVYAETSDAQYNIFAAVNNIFEGFRIAT